MLINIIQVISLKNKMCLYNFEGIYFYYMYFFTNIFF